MTRYRMALDTIEASDTGGPVDTLFAAWRAAEQHSPDNRLLDVTCTYEIPFVPIPDLRTLTVGQPPQIPAAAQEYTAGAWRWTYASITEWLSYEPQRFIEQSPALESIRPTALRVLRRIGDAADPGQHLTIRTAYNYIPRDRYIRDLFQGIADHAATLHPHADPAASAIIALLRGHPASLPVPSTTHLPALRAMREASLSTLLATGADTPALDATQHSLAHVARILLRAVEVAESADTATTLARYTVPAPNIHHISLADSLDGLAPTDAHVSLWRAVGLAHALAADALVGMAMHADDDDQLAVLYAARAARRSADEALETARRTGVLLSY